MWDIETFALPPLILLDPARQADARLPRSASRRARRTRGSPAGRARCTPGRAVHSMARRQPRRVAAHEGPRVDGRRPRVRRLRPCDRRPGPSPASPGPSSKPLPSWSSRVAAAGAGTRSARRPAPPRPTHPRQQRVRQHGRRSRARRRRRVRRPSARSHAALDRDRRGLVLPRANGPAHPEPRRLPHRRAQGRYAGGCRRHLPGRLRGPARRRTGDVPLCRQGTGSAVRGNADAVRLPATTPARAP